MKYVLFSPFFKDGGQIPQKYTCDGENISPGLTWENPPTGSNSFVLLMNDYDAPSGILNHWIIYNIPEHVRELKENILTLPPPSKLGINSWKINGYSGPYPPENSEHKYCFKLYALDSILNPRHRVSSKNIEKIIQPHIINVAVLTGTYKRKPEIPAPLQEKIDFEDATTILRRKDVNQDIKKKAIKEIEELVLESNES